MRALILALAACAFSLLAFQEQPVVEWVRSHAVALKTPEAGHGFDDMQPLKKMVGQARIVALGEATHGTREFFQLKHRMVEFLASQIGFTIFSIEANMPEAYRLNDYVLAGKGDPKALIKGMYFWTWDTEEVLAMIEWMREFNQSGKGRIEFTGFDMQTPPVALQIVKDFCAKYDPEYSTALKDAGDQALKTSTNRSSFGVATATFRVEEAAGKRIRFSGYIKTDRVTDGYAGLWWRVDGEPGKMLAFDNMQNRGATGTTDWKRYQIELPVTANARNINFGVLQTGKGIAWFDSLAIEVDDAVYSGASSDLDFESTPPKGFVTGGQGYRVRSDNEIFHSGKQSLRIEQVLDSPTVTPETATATWNTVVSHLESSREVYIARKAAAPDVEWAVQNARIVVQGLQSRTNQVTRDESMARNIRWIADRNPNAKIILWAHNAHVSAGGATGMVSMGSYLRKIYGPEMVVFGFAFNQGGFQSVEPGHGLHDFNVTPAPAYTLDSILAASKIPIFALDWRQVPEKGPVAEWLNTPQRTRSIGSMYREETPNSYFNNVKIRDAFDVTLFVEKTTAARKISRN